MYQTGTVTSPTALKIVIETFATSNGWGLSGSDFLYKAQSNVKLTVPAGPSLTTLEITGANSSDGLTEPAGFSKSIYIDSASWPVTYKLFLASSPDIIVCVLNYETSKYQQIIFGDLVKVHSSAYIGGNFFFASKATVNLTTHAFIDIGDTYFRTLGPATSVNTLALFGTTVISTYGIPGTGIHNKIDGRVWNSNTATTADIGITDTTNAMLFRNPNNWNSQTLLVPIHVQYKAASSLDMYLGYVEHIRYFRMDNYEPGDIITLGSDRWMVFPWLQKDTSSRNYGNTGYSGTLGFAVRYDGP